MAKIDEIKEKISLYKFFLGIITGIILSIIGYYQHLKTSLIILLYLFALLTSIIIKNIEKLKDL